jgi:BED zinc finger
MAIFFSLLLLQVIMSDTDSTFTHSSFSTYNDREKRKNNLGSAVSSDSDRLDKSERSNRSHTTYFFHKDSNNNEIAYCILCERKLAKKPYPYSRKGGSTSNLSCHLRDKHNITKYNYLEYLDANDEVKLHNNCI